MEGSTRRTTLPPFPPSPPSGPPRGLYGSRRIEALPAPPRPPRTISFTWSTNILRLSRRGDHTRYAGVDGRQGEHRLDGERAHRPGRHEGRAHRAGPGPGVP